MDKGYSQTFSNSVLQELDLRAQQISGHLEPLPEQKQRRKRYLGGHKPMFQKMESISSHYAASRQMQRQRERVSPAKEVNSSATKKRRTLNGPEEMFGDVDKENELPLRRKDPERRERVGFGEKPTLAPPRGTQTSWSPQRTRRMETPERMESPERKEGSPSRFTRISPSKGHMNLNSLLDHDMDTEGDSPALDESPRASDSNDKVFAKPFPKQRQLSLQMAGVAPSSSSLYKLAAPNQLRLSIPSLQKKPSVPSLQKKLSVPNLQKKLSIPNLQKKLSIPNLQKKLSIPSLQKSPSFKSLIPSLQPKQSVPDLQKPSTHFQKPSTHFQKPAAPAAPAALQKKPSGSNLQKPTTLYKKPSVPSLHKKPSASNLNQSPSGTRNFTIPQPFSLYDRPTVLSSQKSLAKEQASRSPSHISLNSMNSEVSQRSLSKFQKFKSRFS